MKNAPFFQRWFRGSRVLDDAGQPRIVYHGTAEEFTSFAPGSFFSESPDESSAYTFANPLLQHEQATGKYRLARDEERHHGKLLPYVGAGIIEAHNPQVGQLYASDQGVMRRLEGRRWAVYSDLVIDYAADAPPDQVRVKTGDALEAAEGVVRDYETYVDEVYGDRKSGGRVIAAYLAIRNPYPMNPFKANRLGLRLGATRESVQQVIDELAAQGYDGIETCSDESALVGMEEIRQWLVFRPDQVVSAISPEPDLQRFLAAERSRARRANEAEFSR